MIEENAAAIDADFFQSVTHLDEGEFFKSIMEELGVIPVMHEYVADVELREHKVAQKLLAEKYIRKITYEDFLSEECEWQKYKEDVWMLFDEMNEDPMPQEQYRDIYREGFHLSGKNLGEVMTELMAKNLRLPIFMSNDKGAKRLAKRYFNSGRYTLEVKNLIEVLTLVGMKENSLKWSVIKCVLNSAKLENEKQKVRHFWNIDQRH